MADLKLAFCNAKAARFAVEHWHYSRIMPASKSIKIGVWEDGEFIGAVVFSQGANPNLGTAWGCGRMETAELARVALRAHKTHVTRIVRIALLMLKRQCPGIRLVVSFADPVHGHHGGIYQAGNWIYAGQTPKAPQYRVNGKWVHPRTLTGPQFGKPPTIGRGEYKKKPKRFVPGKHRYLMPLDRKLRRALQKKAKPYPTAVLTRSPGVGTSGTPAGMAEQSDPTAPSA